VNFAQVRVCVVRFGLYLSVSALIWTELCHPAEAVAAAAPGGTDCAVSSEVSAATNAKILDKKIAGLNCRPTLPEAEPEPPIVGSVSQSAATDINTTAPKILFTSSGMIFISSADVAAQESQIDQSTTSNLTETVVADL